MKPKFSHFYLVALLSVLAYTPLGYAQWWNPLAKSTLPNCPSDKSARFHNCFGEVSFPDGTRYIGEFKDDTFHGRGLGIRPDGSRYSGEYVNGKRSGDGIEYSAEKKVLQSGKWKDGNLVSSAKLDPNKFVFETKAERTVAKADRPKEISIQDVKEESQAMTPGSTSLTIEENSQLPQRNTSSQINAATNNVDYDLYRSAGLCIGGLTRMKGQRERFGTLANEGINAIVPNIPFTVQYTSNADRCSRESSGQIRSVLDACIDRSIQDRRAAAYWKGALAINSLSLTDQQASILADLNCSSAGDRFRKGIR
jgi:hypothetical protein